MKDELHTWFAGLTNRPVIFANQDGPRPALPFVTLLVTSANRSGHASVGEVDDNGQALIQHDMGLMVSVQTFGGDAFADAQAIRDKCESPSAQLSLWEQGFAFIRAEGVNDAAEVIGAGWEPRAMQDIELRTLRSFTDDIGLIETVELTGTIDGVEQPTQTIEV